MKNPISLDGLVSWLKQQDPDTTYNYINSDDCLLCRYFRAVGLPVQSVSSIRWQDTDGRRHPISIAMNSVALIDDGQNYTGTYGGALAVARQLLADERAA